MAIDFDLACATRLLLYDQQREKRQIEAMAAMSFGGAFTSEPEAKKDNVEYW